MSSCTNGICNAGSTATFKILLQVTWLFMTVCCKSWHGLKESSAASKLLIFKIGVLSPSIAKLVTTRQVATEVTFQVAATAKPTGHDHGKSHNYDKNHDITA